MPMTVKTGLDALFTPERSVLLLIDHQPFQFANLHRHEPTLIVNNVVRLAKAAKAFKVPAILTTVTVERGGYLSRASRMFFPRRSRSIGPSSIHGKTSAPSVLILVDQQAFQFATNRS
jgi:nicotinamidase-related amidase